MKTLLTLIACIVFAGFASAQSYAPQSIANIPTSLSAATNMATPPIIDARKQKNVTLAITLTSSGPQTNTYVFGKSVDGTSIDTNSTITVIALTGNGTSRTTCVDTNIGGIGYLALLSITPTGSAIVTNTVKYGIKTQSP